MYSLVWESHKHFLAEAVKDLLHCKSLLDCTLAAEGQFLKVHKLMLVSCSSYFKLLFSEEYGTNPIVILKDVRFNDLKLLVDFMYKGEAVLPSDQVHSFLETAKSLQVLNVQLPNDENIGSTDSCNKSWDESNIREGRNLFYHSHSPTSSDLQRIAVKGQQDSCDCQMIDSIPNVRNADEHNSHFPERGVGNDSVVEKNLDQSVNCETINKGLADGQGSCANHLKCQNVSVQSSNLQDSCCCSCATDGANNESNHSCIAFCSSNQGSELINGNTDKSTMETCGEVLETIKEERIDWEDNWISEDTGYNNFGNETNRNVEVRDELDNVEVIDNSDARDITVANTSPSCVRCEVPTHNNANFEKNNKEDDNLNNEREDDCGEKECSTHSTGKSHHTVGKKKVRGARATVVKKKENILSPKSSKMGLKLRNQTKSEEKVSSTQRQECVLKEGGGCSAVTLISSDKENESSNCSKGDKSVSDSSDAVQCSTTSAPILQTTEASIPCRFKIKSNIFPQVKLDKYYCKDCDKYFTYQSELQVHLRVHNGEKPFQCLYCDKCFSMKSTLTHHMRTHSGDRPFKCKYCDKRYTGRSGLISHLRFHTGEKPFKCEICDRSFVQKVQLRNHLQTHSGERPFKCQICFKRFTRFAVVKAHQLAHFGIRQFKCKVCGKGFSYRTGLTDHERVHTGDRPFKCDHCDRGYSSKRTLAVHVQSHFKTYKETYKCDHCSLEFGKIRPFRVHMKSHKVKAFVCNYCGRKFSHKVRFSMHVRSHKGNKSSKSMNCEEKDS